MNGLERKQHDNPTYYPLTALQKKMWAVSKYFPHSAAYSIPAAIEIKGKISVELLQHCLNFILDKHTALKFKIKMIDDDPVQKLDSNISSELLIIPVDNKDQINELLVQEASTPFDIENTKLFRFVLWQLSDNHAILQMTLHHLISDRQSFSIIIKDIFEIYTHRLHKGTQSLTTQPSFGEYLVDNANLSVSSSPYISTYKEYLAADFPSVKKDQMRGKIKWSSIQGSSCEEIKSFSEKNNTRPFIVLLSAFNILLSRYSSLEEIAVGVPFSTRGETYTNTVGMFVETKLVDCTIGSKDSFLNVINKVTASIDTVTSQQNETLNSLFQCMFIYGKDFDCYEDQSVSMQLFMVDHNQAKFPISLYIYRATTEFKLRLEFNADIFADETIERILLHFKNLLSLLVQNPQEDITKINYLGKTEKKCVLYDWNNTCTPFSEPVFIHVKVEKYANDFPDKSAIVFENSTLTYAELNSLANQLAKKMLEQNIATKDVVAIFFDKSIEMIVSILAIHKIGAVYLPLDKTYLSNRLVSILKHAKPKLILSDSDDVFSTENVKNLNVHAFIKTHINNKDNINIPQVTLNLNDPAYIIYTSGSTGIPKGVIISHASLYNRIAWMQHEYNVNSVDNILHKTSIMFDVSIWEIFLPLFCGSTMIVSKPSGNRDSAYIKDLILAQNITLLHFVPIMLEDFLQNESLNACASLRHVFCSGEALNPSTVKKFYALMPPHIKLHNLYGPTEATVDVSYHCCDPLIDYYKAVPIGKPIWNTALYILDKHLQPVSINIPGELYIGGVAVALGYLKDELLTKERFIPNVFSKNSNDKMYKTGDLAKWTSAGEIIFLGRSDRQVKINGIRIEVAEIENSINQFPSVNNSYVVKKQISSDQYQLAAYIQLNKKVLFEEEKLREHLLNNLPQYMVPPIFLVLDAFPLTNSGKVDINKLPDLSYEVTPSDLPATLSEIESKIIAVWESVLKVKNITINDNFFHLGGDSIKSVTVVTKLKAVGLNTSVDRILAFPTIKTLANHQNFLIPVGTQVQYEPFQLINELDRKNLPNDIVNAYPLAQLQLSLVYHSEATYAYNIYVSTYKLQAIYNHSLLEEALRLSTINHPMLRTYFDLGSYSEPLQLVKKEISIKINVIDLINHVSQAQDAVILEYINAEKKSKFDWEKPPLFRFCVHVLDTNVFQFTISESCLDGWSVSLLAQDIFNNYRNLINGKKNLLPAEPPCDYSHFIANQKAAMHSDLYKNFWRDAEKKIVHSILINKEIDSEIVRIEEELDISLSNKLKRMPLKYNIPLKTVLFATHCIAISKLLNQKTITTGLMSNCRPEISGSEKLVGIFLNVLPITITITDHYWEFINALYLIEQKHIKHRWYPYSEIVNLKNKQRFDTLFNFIDFYLYKDFINSDDFKLLSLKGTNQTLFNLSSHYSILQTNANIRIALDFNNVSDFNYFNRVKNCFTDTIRQLCAELKQEENEKIYVNI